MAEVPTRVSAQALMRRERCPLREPPAVTAACDFRPTRHADMTCLHCGAAQGRSARVIMLDAYDSEGRIPPKLRSAPRSFQHYCKPVASNQGSQGSGCCFRDLHDVAGLRCVHAQPPCVEDVQHFWASPA